MAAVAAAAAAAAFLGNDRTALMLMDHDLRELHRSASLRADGSSTRGRKTKHDTATRRWIDTVGFPMLAQGRLPDAHDIAMLRSGPRSELRGLARDARDAWSQKHARDPRSKQLTDVEARGQQTLLTWARTNAATVESLTRSTAPSAAGRKVTSWTSGRPGWDGRHGSCWRWRPGVAAHGSER